MIKKLLLAGMGILLLIPFSVLPAAGSGGEKSQKAGEQINWEVISAGGSIDGSSASYTVSGTIAQTAVGAGTYTGHIIYHGFWGPYGACNCRPGDADGVLPIDILDIVHLIDFKFKGCPPGSPIGTCPPPTPYMVCSGDADCNCIMDILDIVLMIDWKFKGCPPEAPVGTCPPPCSCGEWHDQCGWLIYK
jgi:hypothetical protein